MPVLYNHSPMFSIAKVLLRPIVGAIFYNSRLHNALWGFTCFAFTNASFFKTILILLSIRKYIYGIINIPSLSNIIHSINPIIGVIFDSVLKPELNNIRINNVQYQISVRRLIN
uniref:hypothetical protein n=1 Tax=Inonotus hispidus TaxID=40469 RepID=UPI0021824A31|nr:hypothetical protein N4M07_mgp003 [Inonotus hispidus]UVF37941.1 hypothetical protein [Inonotus hispidus]